MGIYGIFLIMGNAGFLSSTVFLNANPKLQLEATRPSPLKPTAPEGAKEESIVMATTKPRSQLGTLVGSLFPLFPEGIRLLGFRV